MSAAAPSQTVFSIGYDFHFGAGDNGNVFGITNYKDQNRNQTFTYDALNRLISAQNAGTDCGATLIGGKSEYWGNSYGYDAWGNLLQKSITKCGAENLVVTADAHNWIHASGTDYQYDAAGNMTYDATAGLSYNFDQENRLTGAAGYAYTYDADGNRVRKSSGSTGTLYWYMTPGIVGESDLSGTLTDEYVFFDGERVARKSTNGVFYYFSDHLKTASVITDSAGVIKAESDYYPWGGELQFVANDSNHYKFTGKERDSETGLDYFGARYYSNGLSRWVSADWSPTPIPVPYADFNNPQSLNLYGFVGGNPASKADSDGHDGGAVAVVFSLLEGAGEVTVGGPLSIAFAPSIVGMEVAASHPMENHPADDPPSASNMMLDALNPPLVAAPPATTATTPTDTTVPASTTQASTTDANAQRTTEGIKGGPTAGQRFKPSDRAKDAGKSCVYCGQKTTEKAGKPNSRETDHRYPKSRGGNTTPRNRAPAFRTCNRSKGSRRPKEWRKAQSQK